MASFPPARFEDFEPSDTRVQYFWEALNNFTNGEWTVQPDAQVPCPLSPVSSLSTHGDSLPHPEDRSRFLRFVTGRSRLPARIYIYPDKLG